MRPYPGIAAAEIPTVRCGARSAPNPECVVLVTAGIQEHACIISQHKPLESPSGPNGG